MAAHEGGGLEDLFRSRLLIVYGSKRAERGEILREAAKVLADWSPGPDRGFGSSLGTYPLLSDREALRGTEGHALLLLGGPEDNLLAERLASRLPLGFEKGAILAGGKSYKGAGAALVYPNPENPGLLLGLIDLPFEAKDALEAARVLVAPLRADPATSSLRDSYRTPRPPHLRLESQGPLVGLLRARLEGAQASGEALQSPPPGEVLGAEEEVLPHCEAVPEGEIALARVGGEGEALHRELGRDIDAMSGAATSPRHPARGQRGDCNGSAKPRG